MKNVRLYNELEKGGIDFAILCLPENVVHASGFITLPNLYAVAFFAWNLPLATVIMNVREKKEVLYISDSVKGDIYKLSFIRDVRTYSPYNIRIQTNPIEAFMSGFRDVVAEIIPANSVVGVEAAGLPFAAYDVLTRALPGIQVKDASEVINKSRMVKAPWELERMYKAAKVVDAGMNEFIRTSEHAGNNELDIWKDIVGAMNKQLGGHALISGELVTGPRSQNSSYPGGPIDRNTKMCDVGITDISVRVDGYWCDCCNIVSYGGRNEKQRRLFEIIKAAYENSVAAIKPGAVCSDVYDSAKRAYISNGYECPHYIGHSIGSSLNDMPKIIPCDHTIIEEGMCFSLEPGIYMDGMGLRIEKMVVVTAKGCETFNQFKWGVE